MNETGISNVALLAASFQEAVVDVLAVKTRLAAEDISGKAGTISRGSGGELLGLRWSSLAPSTTAKVFTWVSPPHLHFVLIMRP